MAERVSLPLPSQSQLSPTTTMALLGAASSSARIIPSVSLSSSSRSFFSLSSSSSKLQCLRSSPRISHLFLNQVFPLSLNAAILIVSRIWAFLRESRLWFLFLSAKSGGSRFEWRIRNCVGTEVSCVWSWSVEERQRRYQGASQLQVLPSYSRNVRFFFIYFLFFILKITMLLCCIWFSISFDFNVNKIKLK